MSYKKVWGIKVRSTEQQEALDALMDPSIDLVILQGFAGSGKTLLALAAGLEQVVENKMYKEIVFTRGPVPVGADLGHLPGELDEKLLPWMGALIDNLEVLIGDSKITESVIMNKVKTIAIQHIRGRSLRSKYVIIDEVQNMTPQEIKVVLTRIGEDSKIICLGDVSQIDNKKLNVENNALTYLVNRSTFSAVCNTDNNFIKSIILNDCVRSRLAKWAGDYL